MRSLVVLVFLLFALIALAADASTIAALLLANESPSFPSGTQQFFVRLTSAAGDAAGVWVGTQQGLVHYTQSGPGTPIPVPGGIPRQVAIAADGSLWFATATLIGRVALDGTVLEQYPIAGAYPLTVASGGALWYGRSTLIGRIAGGSVTERASPQRVASLAPAPGGDIWILGFGSATDSVYRMTPAGSVTEIPLGHDLLAGNLQSLPDGTLYIGTGIRKKVLRLAPGAQTLEVVADDLPARHFVADPGGNVWTGYYATLSYVARAGTPRFTVDMPYDARECFSIAAWTYQPVAVDAAGGVWIVIYDDAWYLPGFPCDEPAPPMPNLIRVYAPLVLANHLQHDVPALSPLMLLALAAALALAALFRYR